MREYRSERILELLLRFFIGGAVVSLFAILGDALKPKSFAGIFGAAPSVALATLTIAVITKGNEYAAVEARSMIIGAFAFLLYAYVVSKLMMQARWSALSVASLALGLWLALALGLWRAVIG